MPAVRASEPREAVGEDAAPQVAAKVALYPRRDAPAHGVGVLRLGDEGLQVVLDHRVEWRPGRAAGAIDPDVTRGCSGSAPSGLRRHCARRRAWNSDPRDGRGSAEGGPQAPSAASSAAPHNRPGARLDQEGVDPEEALLFALRARPIDWLLKVGDPRARELAGDLDG